MNEENILTRVRGNLGLITLNRPQAINALSLDMLYGIDRALTDFLNNPRVTAVMIRGAGSRGLCAGGDVAQLYRAIEASKPDLYREYFRTEYTLNYRIARYPKPYISLMDGLVLGGGVGISAHGSHRIVSERTRIGMPETVLGFSPDVGGLKLLSSAPSQLGTMLAMTGMQVGAADALLCGLADYFVPSGRLDSLVDYLETATDTPSIEQAIGRFAGKPPQSRLASHARWISQAFSGHDAQAIKNRVRDHTETTNSMADDILEAFRHNSPTAIKMALLGIRRAQTASLAETLNTDFVVSSNAAAGHDLFEGIRAQIIDKDRSPRWEPTELENVPDDLVRGYFTPTPGLTPLGLV